MFLLKKQFGPRKYDTKYRKSDAFKLHLFDAQIKAYQQNPV